MSRVDDDREQARVAARLAEQKRAEESKKKERSAADSQFSRLVAQQKGEQKKADTDKMGRSAIAALMEQTEAESADEAGHLSEHAEHAEAEQKGFRARLGGKALADKHAAGSKETGEKAFDHKLSSDQGNAAAAQGRSSDQANSGQKADSRRTDAKTQREVQSERAEASDHASDSRSASSASGKGEKGALKTDADKGGGQGQSGGEKKGNEVPQGFRFNPALMAPVPVAKKNETVGSDRLRRMATEIAQKIVERVRVGTNAAGNAEFQIDMRNDVMGGMSVKVSAKNGKISAVFSGSDRDVLKALEEQSEALKAALSSRGLTLEQFKVEARA